MPPSLLRIFEPIEALLNDVTVRQIVMGTDLAVRRAHGWSYEYNPLSGKGFEAAVSALIDALGEGAQPTSVDMQLDAGARLVAMRPPAVDQTWLAIVRPGASDVLTVPGRAVETIEVALKRQMTCLIVGPDVADRQSWMATLAARDERRPIGIDLAVVEANARCFYSEAAASFETLLQQVVLAGPGRIYWDASARSASAMVNTLMRRSMPACIGMPGRTAADGFFGLMGWLPASGPSGLGAAIDLILCVDGARLEAVVSVEMTPAGPTLQTLQRAMPSGGLTDEPAHADWMARWQRLDERNRTTSLPPQSLTEALRVVRQQVQSPAAPEAPRVTRRPGPDGGSADPADPLQALLASLGDAEESADVEDEQEATIVQAEGIVPGANHRTFSEILRSLGQSGEGRMHVRRVTKLGDSD